jgi:hypothetical protein
MISECKVACPRDCGKTIKIGAIDDHSHSPLCDNKEFLCSQCSKPIKNSEMLDHMTMHLKSATEKEKQINKV